MSRTPRSGLTDDLHPAYLALTNPNQGQANRRADPSGSCERISTHREREVIPPAPAIGRRPRCLRTQAAAVSRSGVRFRVLAVVPFADEEESPFVGLLQVEAV
jgi:hypothetical protein